MRFFRIPYWLIVVFLLIFQGIFWYGIRLPDDSKEGLLIWKGTRTIKPELGVVPDLPTNEAVKASSFGDEQFYFRTAAFDLQNAGDTYGRSTSLRKYDYAKLYKWWTILDTLDTKSNFAPSLVSYYYGATRDYEKQIPYVAQYLEDHADHDPAGKWWWYTQAIYHSKHKLKDDGAALRIAKKLSAIPKDVKMPIWAREMEAFVLEDMGQLKEACELIFNIFREGKDLTEGERNFMRYFLRERMNGIKEEYDPKKEFDPKCELLISLDEKKEKE